METVLRFSDERRMELIEVFDAREQALGIWAALILLAGLFNSNLRNSFTGVLKILTGWKILAAMVGMGIWTAVIVLALRALDIWTFRLFKDTVLWFLFSGLVTAFSTIGSDEPLRWRSLLRKNIGIVIALEVVLNTYTYPLLVELALVPVGAFGGGMAGYAEAKNDETARRIAGVVLSILGVIFLVGSVTHVASNWSAFVTVSTLRQGLLHPLLLIGFIPSMYILALIAAYEQLFLQLEIWSTADQSVLRSAKWRIFRRLGGNLSELQAFQSWMGTAVPNFESRAEVEDWMEKWPGRPDTEGCI